jgi:hypothetical protein
MFRRITAAVILSLLSFVAWAGEATLTWTPPTQNTDGTAYTNFGGFKIYYGTDATNLPSVVDIPDTTNTKNTYTITGLAPTTWFFSMTAYNSAGGESDKSGVVSKTISSTVPLPPDPTFVTVETTVYNVVKRDNGFVFVAVATVPLNTPCDITQSVNGKFAVPVSAVTWLGTVKPIVVVATCSAN